MSISYSDHISWQLIDNKIYIIDEITRKIYTLDNVGKEFWLLIADNHSLEAIIEILSEQYNVPNNIIATDINDFTDLLLSQKLLTKGEYCYE